MCNDFGNTVPYSVLVDEFYGLGLPIVDPLPGATPNLGSRDEIWPTTRAPVLQAVEGGLALAQIPWGLAPPKPKARALINLRSEGRSFPRGRCLVPASHYFEFTGTKSPKSRWRFTRTDAEWFCFAGIVGRAEPVEGVEGVAFALITADAGPDVVPIHNRQPVVLDRAAWLDASRPAAELLRPSPVGSLSVVLSPREKTLV